MNKGFSMNRLLTAFIIAAALLAASQKIFAQAPGFQWLKDFGGVYGDVGTAVTVDGQGNIILTGYFDSTLTVGSYTLNSAGYDDIFIIKLDPNGNPLWAAQAGGTYYDEGYNIATDKTGNIYVTGEFSQTAIFGSVSLQSYGNADVFVAKYNPAGKLIWVRQAGSQNYDYAHGIAVDNQDNVIITGSYSGSMYFGGNITVVGNTYSDIYTAKYDSAGNILWAYGAGNEGFYNAGEAVSADNNGNILVTGTFGGTVLFGRTVVTSTGTQDLFLTKYDAAGNVLWVKKAGGANQYTVSNDVAIDKNNNVYLTGLFSGATSFGSINVFCSTQADIFIAKYDTNGNALWVSQDSLYDYNYGQSISLDNASNISLSGSVRLGGSDFGDIYLARYTNTGRKLWSKLGTNSGTTEVGGIATETNGDLVATGAFSDSLDFGTQRLQGIGAEDIFIGRIPVPQLSLGSNTLNFNVVPLGSQAVKSITLHNTGRALLHVTGVTVYDADKEFGIASAIIDSIPPLSSGSLNISFSPRNTLTDNAYLVIESDVPTGPDTVKLIGTGGVPTASYSQKSLNFGTQEINTTQQQFISVNNISSVNFIINKITFLNNGSGDFGLINFIAPDTVLPQGSKIITVKFNPKLPGAKNSLMLVSSNSANSPDTISLTGTGGSSTVTFSSDTLNFGTVGVTKSKSLNFSVKNSGNSRLILTAMRLSGPDSSNFKLAAASLPDTILIGSSKYFSVSFSPLTFGKKTAYLKISSNASSVPDSILLTGSGGSTFLTLTDDTLNFGSIIVNGSGSLEITASNTGSSQLIIQSITMAGINKNEFKIIPAFITDSLSPGAAVNLTVNFNPVSSGNKSALMIFNSNAINSPDTVRLLGKALAPVLSFSPDSLDFGSITINDTSSSFITLYNLSNTAIIINNINISGPNSSEFAVQHNILPDTVIGLNYKYLTVKFSPRAVGVRRALLVFSGPGGLGPDTVKLAGTGQSDITVQVPQLSPTGQDITLKVTPPTGFNFTSAKMYYRITGDSAYKSSDLTASQGYYTGVIPGAYLTISGVQYYIVFSNSTTSVSYPDVDPAGSPEFIELTVPQYTYPSVIPKSEYRMITIPLYVFGIYLDSLFTADYGPYNNSVWRLFRWDPSSQSYGEYTQFINEIMPGSAFWLIQKDGKPFTLKETFTVPSVQNYPINLQPGWNQIGDPFAFPVDWDSIENSDQVQAPIGWNPQTQDYELNQTVLQPWDGYWVYNPVDSGTVYIFVKDIKSQGPARKTADQWANLKSDEFILQLKAGIESSGIEDMQNFVGMMENAKDGKDKYDILKPPPVTGNLNLNIISGGKQFAENIVGTSKEGAYWNIEIKSGYKGKTVVIQLDQKSTLPDGFNIWFLSLTDKSDLPVDNGSVRLTVPGSGKGEYRIIVGKEDYAKQHSENIPLVPLEYALYQNYPNPFNPTTDIEYQLKENSNVSLTIYNILGQRIKVLINNLAQGAGRYTVTWDGTNSAGEKVASGIYIYRIIANKFNAVKKMVFLK